MRHQVRAGSGQIAEFSPEPAQPRHFEELLALREALLHPGIMGPKISTPTVPGEGAAPSVDGPYALDETRQVVRERHRSSGILLRGGRPRQPGLYRPGQRIAASRPSDPERLRSGERGPTQELAGRIGLEL